MDEKVSRNASCPCGSGKKYKKCCGAGEVISLSQVLETEVDDLQKQLLHFALRNYGNEIAENFEDIQEEYSLENEDEINFFEFIHTIWFTLFVKSENDETILDRFIAFELRKIKRPKLKQILQSWKNARTIAGRIIRGENNNYIIEDLFTHEQLETVVVTILDKQYEAGVFFTGILLPFDQKYVFFPAPFELSSIDPEDAVNFLKDSMFAFDYDDPKEFLTELFVEMMAELPTIHAGIKMDELEWSDPIYKEIAELFQEECEQLGTDPELMDTGIYLWNIFCLKKPKRIKNPNLYAAALHYFVSMIAPGEWAYTQKELAEKYGVSASSISSVYRELASILPEDLEEDATDSDIYFSSKHEPTVTERALQGAMVELQGKEFQSMDEVNDFLSKKLSSQETGNVRDKALELLDDAFDAEGQERYRLAEKALKLDPSLVDAYNILAENARSLEEAIQFYEKGIWIGQKNFGKSFFKKNNGYFWGLFETRPFMRAKYNYADALHQLGKVNEAISQYEELLELNPDDNQGVRFSLFVAYVEKRDLPKAHGLLDKYNEGTAQSAYNRLLLELLENGFSTRAGMLLKQAKDRNKFVIPYLKEKKRLPIVVPDLYGFGDENEAIMYADAHLHLWRKIIGDKDWLK